MRRPAITVVIPNYNNERYLAECLDSILRQSFEDMEIIVTDDGSTDGSVDIAEQYARQYPGVIRLIIHERNRGVAANRHAGILAARGEYLTTLDSDDLYEDKDKLKAEYALVRQHEQEGRDIIAFSNVRLLMNDTSTQIVGTDQTIREGDIFELLVTRSCFIPRDFLFKRELYHRTGGYKRAYAIYEDWNLKLKLAQNHPFFYTGKMGVIYRRHGQGLSNAAVNRHLKYLRKSFLEMMPALHDEAAAVSCRKAFELNLQSMFGPGYRKANFYEQAFFRFRCVLLRARGRGGA